MKANIPKNRGGDMNSMLRQAQKMQEEMEALQTELDAREYEISAGGGMVKLKMSGKKEVLSIDISPDIVDPDDVETLADVITAAVNEALKRVEDTNSAEMAKVTGAFGMPGMF